MAKLHAASLHKMRGRLCGWGLLSALNIAAVYGQGVSARPAFEVASIKPSPSASRGFDLITDQMHDGLPFADVPTDPSGRRVNLHRYSLVSIIAMAYGVRAIEVSAPSWTSEKRFEIEAILPEGAPSRLAGEMMQSLLRERFALQVHQEKKQQVVYALIVGKDGPKLRASTPSNAASTADASAPPAISRVSDGGLLDASRPALWSRLSGATMEDLARSLSRFVGERVIDMTKLEGRYDVSIAGYGRGLGQDNGTDPSIFDAIEDLGLRLDRRKAEVDVLVVDSVAKEPTEN